MKATIVVTALLCSAFIDSVKAQGTLLYDQQSADESIPTEAIVGITSFQQPVGQSFAPSLAAVGFIRLKLLDGNPGNGLGATVYVNLRADSITGLVLSSSTPVFIPDTFSVTFTDFLFPIPVPVAPGTTYFLQPVIQSGDGMLAGRLIMGTDYTGGTEFINGQAGTDDLWFREGVVVPEPSLMTLFLLGGAGLAAARSRHRRQ